MTKLESLVEISRYYGNNSDYVIAGGGNTSYKDDEKLYVKASGVSLGTIDQDGFVVMSREHLSLMEDKTYPEDAAAREEEVKQDLKRAIIEPEHLRPSVETSLHNLIGYAYIVHTHPTLVNALMCAKNAREEIEDRFGTEALYMEYTDPGYILFKKLQEKVVAYQQEFNRSPRIIFLQNHGIFVGADTGREVQTLYDYIMGKIGEGMAVTLPGGSENSRHSDTAAAVARIFEGRNLMTEAFSGPLCNHYSASEGVFRVLSKPFTPDIIVYCKSNYLFLEQGLEEAAIEDRISSFETQHGYYPKVIMEEKEGLIVVEESEKSIATVKEVFTDMMKIAYLSEQFGGPSPMTNEQVSFIDNWEVENYRRKVAKS
ncbi:MAG: class II aldolase/adducin family protein [Bacteroidota bacterium]